MNITINDITFTEIDTNYGPGILMHYEPDIYNDGDQITANTDCLPENAEDAEIMIQNEPWTSYFHEENGVYYFD